MVLYSIYDRVADDFGPILTCKNDAVARRAFLQALKGASLDDYDLYRVGDFEGGHILSHSLDPVRVMIADKEE